MTILKSAHISITMLVLLCVTACATFQPVPLEELAFKERVDTEEHEGLRVSVSTLSREEAKQAFGVNLQKRGIQPVWLEIENGTDKDFWFMMTGLDPNYFSAHEAAYMNHFRFGGKTNKQIDNYFSDLGLDQTIKAGETNSGFAFTNETVGTKEIRVKLYSNKDVRTFEFFVSVPGVISEWDSEDIAVITSQAEINIETEQELQEILRALPCCTQREDGTGNGDPLNLVLIGGIPTVKAFVRAGWDEAAFQRDFRAFFGAAYFYGRPPDVQFQKVRRRVDSVNLVQLWITPYRYRGELVLVASVGRNIDPNVDEAVQYVVEDLAMAGALRRFGRVDGVGAVSRETPRRNFANAPYWTGGERAVLEISQQPVDLEDIEFFSWKWSRRIRRVGDE
jgi:hypothetical protein